MKQASADPAAGELGTEPVYVFGSNLAGEHEGESASFAATVFGAQTGKSSGMTGHAYAIPYRNSARELLPPDVIRNYVESFLGHARAHPQTRFRIARFACRSGAHSDGVMSALFAKAPANCQLPGLWSAALNPQQPARLLLFDPGAHFANEAWRERLREYLAINAPLWNVPAVELVSLGSARMIVANDRVARQFGLEHRVFTPNEKIYGRHALAVNENRAVWYATHLLSVIDLEQTAEPHQVRIIGAAARSGLDIDQLAVGVGQRS